MTFADRSRNELRAAMERYGAATPDDLYRMQREEMRQMVDRLVLARDVDGLIELCMSDSTAASRLNIYYRNSHYTLVRQVMRACYAEVN